jgi:branched-chain amino acid transport system ATP-binding protein
LSGGNPALEIEDVSVHFGGVSALDSVSVVVERSTITGLIGPNGAGKTTLFNVVSGLQKPDHGVVRLDGTDVSRRSTSARSKKGLARTFQRLEVFGSLTVSENIDVAVEATTRLRPGSRKVTRTRTSEIIHRLGLEGVADRRANTLSTGLSRLVELGRAMATRPSVLLLDEPSSGLDVGESAFLEQVLRGLSKEGLAILLVEHDVDLVMRACQSIFVLDFGLVIATGSPDRIRADARVQAAYLGEMNVG